MTLYKHLFFDLDRTLWDFERNANETFNDIYHKYQLTDRGVTTFDDFMEVYHGINKTLWDYYRKGQIEKEVLNVQRFAQTLDTFGIDDLLLSNNIAHDYIELSPTKKHLFPDTVPVLEYLSGKYELHLITNGFEEVQFKKLINSNLMHFFTHVITSEEAGYKKPDPNIFIYALNIAGTTSAQSLMIGDDQEVDIAGAREVGIDQVLVDYDDKYVDAPATFRVTSLSELLQIL